MTSIRELSRARVEPPDITDTSRLRRPGGTDRAAFPSRGTRDAIVVLGSSTNPDSEIMQARVERAVELWQRGVAPYLLMSGRCSFRLDEVPERTEAGVMAAYAASLGVPTRQIVLEEESADTLGNAYFSKVQVLEVRRWFELVIVTSETHARRARWLFEKVLGREYRLEVVSVPTAATEHDRGRALATDARLLREAQMRLEGIADGDHGAIRAFVPSAPQEHRLVARVSAAG